MGDLVSEFHRCLALRHPAVHAAGGGATHSPTSTAATATATSSCPVQPQDSQVVDSFLGTKSTEDSAGQPLPAPGLVHRGGGERNGRARPRGRHGIGARGARLQRDVGGKHHRPRHDHRGDRAVLEPRPSSTTRSRCSQALSGLAVIGYDPGLPAAPSSTSANAASSPTHHRRRFTPEPERRRGPRDGLELLRQHAHPAPRPRARPRPPPRAASTGQTGSGSDLDRAGHPHRQPQPGGAIELGYDTGAVGPPLVHPLRRRGPLTDPGRGPTASARAPASSPVPGRWRPRRPWR